MRLSLSDSSFLYRRVDRSASFNHQQQSPEVEFVDQDLMTEKKAVS